MLITPLTKDNSGKWIVSQTEVASQFDASADNLSRGRAYWEHQVRLAEAAFTRAIGNERLQYLADLKTHFRGLANRCPTRGPCSRKCVGL